VRAHHRALSDSLAGSEAAEERRLAAEEGYPAPPHDPTEHGEARGELDWQQGERCD